MMLGRIWNQGPTRLADSIVVEHLVTEVSTGEYPSLIRAKAPPALDVVSPSPQQMVRMPTTYRRPTIIEPHLGGRALSPDPVVFISPDHQLPQEVRINWRRPDVVIPGSFLP